MGRRLLTTLIVAAHPDDEVLGAGIWLHRHSGSPIYILHITDGSPRDMQNAREVGFSSRKSYARARREELAKALSMVGVPPENCTQFSFADKESYLHLPALVSRLGELVARLQPDQVLSPAYEGGHPDHDAAAFAVAVVRKRSRSFRHWEFPLYHATAKGRMITGRFIANGVPRPSNVISLTREERALKSQMLDCFPTQKEFLSLFGLRAERFRRVGAYDFTKPPHPGPLLYERWGWGISGMDWRERAGDAFNFRSY